MYVRGGEERMMKMKGELDKEEKNYK